MNQKKAKLKTPAPDDALRVGDFQLLPRIAKPPVITSHPIRNFNQTTWGALLLNDGRYALKYNTVKPLNSTFTIRTGTAVSWGLYCSDPSNLNNPNDTTNITFTWKRDNFPLHNINRQNNGYGTPFMSFSEEECVQGIDGVYVCELANEYGVTKSVPFTLRVVNLDTDIKLYTNLIQNGDAEGGLDKWNNVDGLIAGVTSRTDGKPANSLTTYPQNYIPYGTEGSRDYIEPLSYRFQSKLNKYSTFYSYFNNWYQNTGGWNGTLLDYSVPTSEIIDQAVGWQGYVVAAFQSPVIPNEDYYAATDNPSSFFPGAKYLDNYNRNSSADITLADEMSISKSRPLNYFTRNVIKFEEQANAEFDQVISLNGLESLIAGQVGGVDYLTAQFFSYVAVAISRYTIKVTIDGVIKEFNWFIHKYDIWRSWAYCMSLDQFEPDPFTDIEIIPHTDDTTTVSIDVLDKLGKLLTTKDFEGPKALDIWAIKEKTQFSTSLYGLVQFFQQKNNPIKVFGQTYVRSNKIPKLYDSTLNGKGNLAPSNLEAQANGTLDQNAKFIFKRMGELYSNYNRPYPQSKWLWDISEGGTTTAGYLPAAACTSRQDKAYVEKGAEAFFAVGGDITLPPTANKIKIRVQFNNTSPARNDTAPANKDWKIPEIYNTLYSVSPGGPSTYGSPAPLNGDAVSRPYFKYGAPRCGITKMKLMVIPNGDIASPNHVTYAIPDPQYTVAGVAKARALKPVWDSSTYDKFRYDLIMPENGLISPEATTTFIDQQAIEDAQTEYNSVLSNPNISDPDKQTQDQERSERIAAEDAADTSMFPVEGDSGDGEAP